MYYNKYKLYYPDPYVSGGSEGEGGGGDTEGGGEAGPSGSTGGAPQDNTGSTGQADGNDNQILPSAASYHLSIASV